MKIEKKHTIVIILWLIATAMIRLLFYLYDYTGVLDSYGYFDASMLMLEENDHVLSSGLAFAYTNAIVKILSHFSYNINALFFYHLILELIALLILFLACTRFWRFKTALIICSVLSISPVLIEMVRICSPEEYFLFYFSFIFYFLSIFSKYTRKHHWIRSTLNELIVLGMGVYSGIIITWNYMGLLLVLIMIIIVIRNYRLLNDKKQVENMVDGDELDEGMQVMSIFNQMSILFFGIVVGMFFTLMKYTGYSGLYLVDQFKWYLSLYKTLPGKTMDFDTTVAILLVVFMFLGILIDKLFSLNDEQNENEQLANGIDETSWSIETEQAFVDRGLRKMGESTEYFIAPDGRKINYLENPIDLPKKKEFKDPRFDIKELIKENKKVIIFDAETDVEERPLESVLDADKIDESIKKRVKYVNPNISNPLLYRMNSIDFDYDVDDDDDFDV